MRFLNDAGKGHGEGDIMDEDKIMDGEGAKEVLAELAAEVLIAILKIIFG